MRPKDLKIPFTWRERAPRFHEGVLVVPAHYTRHREFSLAPLIPSGIPLSIEYCSGNGDWVIDQALKQPEHYWIAVEKQFERVRKIWSKMRNQEVQNLLIVCGDALTFTSEYLWDRCAEEIFVNFPDPWPKPRHAKHRLIQAPFVNAITRVVKHGGRAVYVTDHHSYARQMVDEMQRHPNWASEDWKDPSQDYGRSWFRDLFEGQGSPLHFIQYRALQ